jgi:adenylate cyclase
MRERVDELGVGWRARGHHLGFGVGVSLGYATLGLVGFEGRFDYMANGSVVVLAARLCAEAEAGQIVVSQRVLGALGDAVEAAPLGALPLKGFPQPVPAFNVLRLVASESRPPAP